MSLLAYSPLAMGLLTGKYHLPDSVPRPVDRLVLYRGRYAEAEGRYGLEKPNVRPARRAHAPPRARGQPSCDATGRRRRR